VIEIEITADNEVRMLHNDEVDLSEFGEVTVTRASHVEFANRNLVGCPRGTWYVRSAKTGEVLASKFKTRAEALAWEKVYYSPSGEGWAELTEGNQ